MARNPEDEGERYSETAGGSAAQLPLVKIRILAVTRRSQIPGRSKAYIQESMCTRAGLGAVKLPEEETFKCAEGRRPKVARQARGVEIRLERRQFRMDLRNAGITQEIILGYEFLQYV